MIRYFKIMVTIGILTLLAFPARGEDKILQIRGSDTIVNLVQRLAEVYSTKNPGEQVSVTGGGSGTGIAGLRNKTVDIADSSRPMFQREIVDMKAKGVDPVSAIIGIDCIALIVNEKSKVDKLTIAQLRGIFRGEVKSWKEVGGDDMPVTLYGRQSNSGTYEVFKEVVVDGEYSEKMQRTNGNSQIVEGVKNDSSGIGYVGIGYLQGSSGVKPIKIAVSDQAEYIDPRNRPDVVAGKYPITRPLYQYTDGIPSGPVKDFIKFELSPEGQKIVDDTGFIPLTKEYEEVNKRTIGI